MDFCDVIGRIRVLIALVIATMCFLHNLKFCYCQKRPALNAHLSRGQRPLYLPIHSSQTLNILSGGGGP